MTTTEYSVENNVKYLASGMFYLGFGNKHEDTLMQKLNSNLDSFQIAQLSASQIRGADFNIDFKKPEGQEWTNLSGYRATLKENPEKTQYFSVYKNHGVTNKQAFNMLEGRSVCREHVNKAGMKYEVWNKLDFDNRTENGNFVTKKYPENHGFSIEAAFKKIDFAREMPDWAITSLKKGDEINASVLVNGQPMDLTLTANPDTRTIDGRDIGGNLVLQAEGINELLVKDKQQAEQTEQSQHLTENSLKEEQTPDLETSVQQNKEPDFWPADMTKDQYLNAIERTEQEGIAHYEKESEQQQSEAQQPTGDHAADQQSPKEEQQSAQTKDNPVTESIKNDPAQKKTAADPVVKSEKAKVEKIPRRSHPPLQQSAQGQGKKR